MKQCLECGNEFEEKSATAKFCSKLCKQKTYRKRVAEVLKAARSADFSDLKPTAKKEVKPIKVSDLPKKSNDRSNFRNEYMKKKLGL